MNRSAIIIDNVSKKFARSLKRGMIYGLTDMAYMAFLPGHWKSRGYEARVSDAAREKQSAVGSAVEGGNLLSKVCDTDLRPSEFWALRNVSFKVEQGETLALLGANGAGKSTMFSVLSGIYAPTYGSVSYRGRLQALIALGAGFHPALTGRENLYINAAILGMKEKQVNAIYDSILDFAGIGAFIDSPIRNYSSGMLVRLAFSIAIHLDPDVLLIDEVLAVGDAAFQMKCAKYTRELANSGKTIVVVSHNLLIVQMMCRRAIWLDKGQILQQGDTHTVTKEYQKFMMTRDIGKDLKVASSTTTFSAAILDVKWHDAGGSVIEKPEWGRPCKIVLEIEAYEDVDCARLWVSISAIGKEGTVMYVSMFDDGHFLSLRKGSNRVALYWESLPLSDHSSYQISAGLRDWSGHVVLSQSYASASFDMNEQGTGCLNETAVDSRLKTANPLVTIPYRWVVEDQAIIRNIHEHS
ncbi:MAG: ATP-binding cassette domain-containing protein [Verrucomicrobia bacterium]|nr:ATP-binding cassette domain-containing protein [Verrucomicrobiota bacterium]